MDKLKLVTPNLVNKNIEKIKQIFPDCITEHIGGGKLNLQLILISCDRSSPVT